MSDEGWRAMDRAALDRAYDNFNAVADAPAHLARWARLSAELRAARPEMLDLRYGPRPRNRIDLFASGTPDAPLLVFIHGGYWQRNAKEDFACMALGPLALGMDVALIGYTLAPDASLTAIVAEIHAALAFLRERDAGRARRLVVSGWSAGGHLAALAMAWPEVDAGLAISGLYDLAPIRATNLNDKLGLSSDEVGALSPIHRVPRRPGRLVIAYGADELPELRRQSVDYHTAWRAAGLEAELTPIAHADHFSILDGLLEPSGALARAVFRLGDSGANSQQI